MRRSPLLLLASILLFTFHGQAQAGAIRFGIDETVHHLQNVKLEGPKGEKLFLGHKSAIRYFVAGVYIRDDGYVLGVVGGDNRYFPMPDGSELARLQQAGLLPNPLPKYALGVIDHAIGNSLWLVIATVLLWIFLGSVRKNRKLKKSASGVS